MNNQTDVSIKFRNYVEGSGKLEKYAQTLATINAVVGGFDKNSAKALEQSALSTQNISKEVSSMSNLTKLAFNYSTAREFSRALQRVFSEMSRLVTKSTEYLENINLYQVAFDGYYQSADRFINKMSEMYGLDESWLTRTVGVFRQMANAMGVSAETGERLSTILTQMSVDISSLYNTDMERASSVLQSALAGQTKPIRGLTGGDITQATLQTTLDNLGIDQAVASLSFAEKRLLIIISLTKQLNESIGDMGRTIESPANQMRVLNSQWERLSRATGNVFLPILSKILPYLNAILMVMTEIMESVAILFGYNKSDFDYFAGTADSVLELEEGLNGASESAKKLKQGLRGFDKLNVISTPSKASATAGAGGVDPDIMNAFNSAFDEYQSKLDNVQMKATKIRDAVMEWLGFTKKLNPITGEVEWTYQGIATTIKNIFEWFVKLNPKAKILVGLMGALFAKSLIKNAQTIVKLLGKTGLGKIITNMISPLKTLGSLLKIDLQGGFYGLGKAMSESVDLWSKNLTGAQKFGLSLLGTSGVVIGLDLTKQSMRSVTEEGWTLSNSLEAVGGGLSTIIGGALTGASWGGMYGAIFGGIAGAIGTMFTALVNYNNEYPKTIEDMQKSIGLVNEYTDSLKAQYDTIDNNLRNQTAIHDANAILLEELGRIVTANGEVKSGYEERAQFIVSQLNQAYGTEIQIIDGKISKYQDEVNAIKDIIAKKKEQLYLEAGEEKYKIALQERASTYNNLKTAQENYNDAKATQAEYEKTLTDIYRENEKQYERQYGSFEQFMKRMASSNKEYKDIIKNTKDAKTSLDDATDAYDLNTKAILNYEGLLTASSQDNAEAVAYYISEMERAFKEGSDGIELTLSDTVLNAEEFYNSVIRTAKNSGKEITDEVKNTANRLYNEVVANLTNQTQYVDGISDEYAKAWGTLSEKSEEKFLQGFKELPEDIQTEVIDKMYAKGYKISDELKKGIEAINPKVKIDADTKSLGQKLKDLFNGKNSLLGKIGFTLPSINWKAFGFADGGLPPVGQLFVANERGAELVGHIGGKTFVANQNQMMELLDKKIGNAQSGGNQTFIIQVGDEEVAKVVLNKASEIAKTNGKPIKIG